jgi:toxin ParE1/3/4
VRRRLLVRHLAKSDLVEQAKYIAGDSLDAALRFLDAAEAAFERLRQTPGIGRRRQFTRRELAGVRSWPVQWFEKHVIFYREAGGGVEILRVLHTSRDLPSILGPERR